MVKRTVTKSLIVMEDIAQGKGQISQTRAGLPTNVHKVDVYYAVDSEAEMTALDIAVYSRASVYSSETVFINYIFDSAAIAGIAPDVGAGFWIIVKDTLIANYQSLRDYTGVTISLWVQGQVTHADGGESFFQLVTGAAPGFYVDDNKTIIVPTGGDGSSAWIKDGSTAKHIDRLNPVAIAIAIADATLQNKDVLNVVEHTAGNGGAGIWVAIIAGTTPDVDLPNGTDIRQCTGAPTLAVKFRLSTWIEPKQLGAIADGEGANTDNTAIVQRCFDLGKVRFDGKYAVTSVTATNYVTMLPNAKLIFIGTSVMTVLHIETNFGELYVSGNNRDCTCISLDTVSNIDGEYCYAENITASATSGTSIFGVRFNAANVQVDKVETFNTINTGQANGSVPQAVGLVGASSHIQIGTVYCRDGTSGLVVANTGRNFIETIHCRNMADNGVYNLGADLDIGDFIYEGTEEAYVCSGGRNFIRSLTTIGPCAKALGFQVNSDVYVGEIIIKDDGFGSDTCTKPVGTRNGAGNIGRVHIGSIRGHIKGNGVISLANVGASVEYLQIDNVDVLLDYDAGFFAGWITNAWFDIANVEQCNIKNVTIRIRDINDSITATTVFTAALPIALTKDSIIENFDMYFESADGTPHPFMIGRGGPASGLLELKGQVFEPTGLFREATFKSGQRDSITAIPTGGTWKTGRVLYHNDTSGFDWGFYCNAGGDSGGSWITLTGQT